MPVPRWMAISDATVRSDLPWSDWIDELLAAGVDTVQIREKHEPTDRLLELAQRTVQQVAGRMQVLINGRVDVALATGADGVHLPSSGLPVHALRRRFGADLLIGCSAHHEEEIERARAEGADYVTFSPVFETPSKASFGSPQGAASLKSACGLGLPVVALGGIEPENAQQTWRAGAAGIAAIRSFHDNDVRSALLASYPGPS